MLDIYHHYVHQTCTMRKKLPGLACCVGCSDYLKPLQARQENVIGDPK